MAALLKDAIKPNLVQTLENNIALIHGGPFANIAHGCNTVTATKTALKIADYTVTEAGFGADLGAEKFINIKCRKSGITPSAVVLVATLRALKFHGGIDKENLNHENLEALKQGFENLERHYNNVTKQYGLPCVICINHFTFDTDEEIQLLLDLCQHIGAQCIVSKHWAQGGAGALQLAEKIVDIVDNRKPSFKYVYDDKDSLWDKITAIATKLYGASDVTAPLKIRQQIDRWEQDYGSFPVCIAKTQMSFSTDPTAKGAPSGHTFEIREVRLANGAEFMVAIAGNMMTMPGLPKTPAAERIDIEDNGTITGLF